MKTALKHFILYGAALCVLGPGALLGRRDLDIRTGTGSRTPTSETFILTTPDTEMGKGSEVRQMFIDTGTELSSRTFAYIVPLSCRHNHWALWSPWIWSRYGLRR